MQSHLSKKVLVELDKVLQDHLLCQVVVLLLDPMPRSYEQKLNKKVVLKAIRSILLDKLNHGKLHVVTKLESTGKTKEMYNMLNERDMSSSLVVVDKSDSLVIRACANLRTARALILLVDSVFTNLLSMKT